MKIGSLLRSARVERSRY